MVKLQRLNSLPFFTLSVTQQLSLAFPLMEWVILGKCFSCSFYKVTCLQHFEGKKGSQGEREKNVFFFSSQKTFQLNVWGVFVAFYSMEMKLQRINKEMSLVHLSNLKQSAPQLMLKTAWVWIHLHQLWVSLHVVCERWVGNNPSASFSHSRQQESFNMSVFLCSAVCVSCVTVWVHCCPHPLMLL